MILVVFDFDGTLVDTVPAFAAAMRAVGGGSGGEDPSTKQIQRMLAGASSYREIFEALSRIEVVAEADPERSAARIEEAFHEAYPTHGKLYPGVYRLLMALKGEAVCGVVGSAPPTLLDEMVDYFGLEGYIAHTFPMAAEGAPLRERMETSISGQDLSPADTFWVSSRPIQLELAHDLGLETIYAAYGYGADPSVPIDHRLDRLSGLFRLFS